MSEYCSTPGVGVSCFVDTLSLFGVFTEVQESSDAVYNILDEMHRADLDWADEFRFNDYLLPGIYDYLAFGRIATQTFEHRWHFIESDRQCHHMPWFNRTFIQHIQCPLEFSHGVQLRKQNSRLPLVCHRRHEVIRQEAAAQ